MSGNMRNNGYYFQTEALTVGYNGVPLIKNIDICLGRGEILTMIGPNGAGKTTILKSIMGQLQSLAGTVCLDGSDLASMSGKELAQKMSVVLTARVRPELMTCEDVVATGRYPYTGRFGVLSAEDLTIVRQSMEMVHIAELADRDFTRISDGQKQRVMLGPGHLSGAGDHTAGRANILPGHEIQAGVSVGAAADDPGAGSVRGHVPPRAGSGRADLGPYSVHQR